MQFSYDKNLLTQKSKEIRKSILKMTTKAKSGHIAGPLGITDIFTYLYFYYFKEFYNLNIIDIPLILSCAHYAPVLYATLIEAEIIPKVESLNLRKFGSILQGHTKRNPKYGIYNSGGSLGQGLGLACGMAIADRKVDIFCIISDGETNEGSIWEAAMFANKYKLDNLYVILDKNGIQQSGTNNLQMPLLDLDAKWKSFGWGTVRVNGNDFESVNQGFNEMKNISNSPKIMISYTIPGKGYSKIENDYKWHGKSLPEDMLSEAIDEINKS